MKIVDLTNFETFVNTGSSLHFIHRGLMFSVVTCHRLSILANIHTFLEIIYTYEVRNSSVLILIGT